LENLSDGSIIQLHNNSSTIQKKIAIKDQVLEFSGLLPSTIYRIEILNSDNELIDNFPIITKSLSSGEIRIYFNRNTDESFSSGPLADGETASVMEDAIIELIDAAQHTLSICAYNTNRENVVNALRRAYDRGVEIRLIADIDNNNTGLQSNIPFPVLYGSIGDGIMHNKFIISDATFDDLAWVQTGSVNYTNFQVEVDPNNSILIQDKSLAQVYLTEFEEMWGGSGAMPDRDNSKFGQSKSDNTPHLLNINDIEVQSYFSPSDNTDAFIVDRIDAAQEEIDVAMLIFTRWKLRDALIAAHNRGVTVKVLVEDQENSQDVLDRFEQAGLTTYYIDNQSTQLHHKYAIIDEGSTISQPYLVTGSQNWTYSGNTFNDENTLIFKDADIANIFKQEFQNLWQGTATSTDEEVNKPIDLSIKIIQNELHITSNIDYSKVFISSMNGQYVSILSSNNEAIDINHLPTGIYTVTIRNGGEYHSTKVFID
ncbi:phospholipase D-like domain-containing protein, partial [Saprospiraceae bacterium]|nr:phospholipase D-like domain-containing protein [Saprospiraceae bacterium]